MGIPTFDVDVEIISKLGSYPGADNGLTPEGFRAKFDLAAKLIKEYINTILLPNINMTTDVEALVKGVEKQLTTVFNINLAKYFESVVQAGNYVLNTGYRFSASKLSNTLVSMYGGEAVIQGHLVSLTTDEAISVAISPGTYGTYRNDLICLRFSRTEDGTESSGIVYLEGETNQSGGVDPTYRQENLNVLAAAVRDYPLYRIKVENTTATLEALFTPSNGLADNIAEDAADKVIDKLSVWEGGSF